MASKQQIIETSIISNPVSRTGKNLFLGAYQQIIKQWWQTHLTGCTATGIIILACLIFASAAGPLNEEKSVLGISFGTLIIYPPEINRYLSEVEKPLLDGAWPRRLFLAQGIEARLDLRPVRFLYVTPWIAGTYCARRFRNVSWNFFVPSMSVPVVMRLADAAAGLRVQFGGYPAGDLLRIRGGASVSYQYARLHIIENMDHELTANGVQLSLTGGCQLRLFNRVFFNLEADFPLHTLPLNVTKNPSFDTEYCSKGVRLPSNAYLWSFTLRPELRINLKKRKILPDVL